MIKVIHASTDRVEFKDQVKIQDYYDKGWTHILRPKLLRNELVNVARVIANTNLVGYSQTKRTTLYNYLKSSGKLENLSNKVYCDCSSFVETCLISSGIKDKFVGITTRTMIDTLSDVCDVIKFKNKDQLEKGDILLKVGSHCVIVWVEENSTNTQLVKVQVNTKPANNSSSSEVGINYQINNWVGEVIASSLIVRDAPNGTRIKSLFNRDRVAVVGSESGWYHIRHKDIDGWVSSKYIVRV